MSDLQAWKAEWPGQDTEQHINRLDDMMTKASTQMDTSAAASDLLERAIDYLEEQRGARC